MAFRTNKMPVLQEKSASGAVATFNTALAMPLASCNIAVTPTQSGSGTPSPDNVRTINGVSAIQIQNTCGINLWDEQWVVGGLNANTGANANFNDRIRCKGYVYVHGLDSIGIYASSQYITVVFYDENRQYISGAQSASAVRNVPNNAYFMRFSLGSDYGTTYNHDFSVNYPSSDTAYHAFQGQSFYIQIGSTVYGGTYDARTGVLTVTHKGVDLGSFTWGVYNQMFYTDLDNAIIPTASVVPDILCSMFMPVSRNTLLDKTYNNSVSLNNSVSRVNIYSEDWTSTADFKTAVTGQILVYPLATPTKIQLPPCPIDTLQGVNNIWADTGETSLTYKDLDIAKRGNFREVFKLPS